MSNQYFDFKQFRIAQDRCAMKVGTDGVLLGSWAPLRPSCSRILDIGTGTGLIALMLAQRVVDAHVDAIEIDADAAAQAAENAAASPFSSRIRVHHCSLQDFDPSCVEARYDLIVSNPPFYNATLKPDDEARAAARHCDSLPLRQIMECASHRLTPSGSLALIYPVDYSQQVLLAAALEGLVLTRLCHVCTKEGKAPKRCMAVFALKAEGDLLTETLLLRNADSSYSETYRQITDPFYLSLR